MEGSRGGAVHFPSYIISKTQSYFSQLLAKARLSRNSKHCQETPSNFQETEKTIFHTSSASMIQSIHPTSRNPAIPCSVFSWVSDLNNRLVFISSFTYEVNRPREAKQSVQSHKVQAGTGLDSYSFF